MSLTERRDHHRRPSISDVARQAGVSVGAVSKVIRDAYGISPSMRTRVQAAIEELDYRPRTAARSMRGASFTIGFEVPNLGNDLFSQVVSGTAGRLHDTGYQLVIAPSFERVGATAIIDALIDRQVDGIIAVSYEVTTEWLERRSAQVPIVVLGRHDDSVEYDTVIGNDVAGVDLVMDHLLDLGHRRIVHLTIDAQTATTPQAVRAASYQSRMQNAGHRPEVVRIDGTEEAAHRAALTLLQTQERPTAIFAGYDTLAVGVLRAVANLGLDAADVSVAGYDNIDLAGHPLIGLTTVDQSGAEMGTVATDLLLQRIQHGRTEPVHHQIEPSLCIRRSTQRRP